MPLISFSSFFFFFPPRLSALPPFSHLKPLASTPARFEWADALRFGSAGGDEPSDLSGFFQKVRICNRGSEKKGEFVPFLIDDEIAGYTHKEFSEHLREFHDVFTISSDENENKCDKIALNSSLKSYEDRTEAVAHVIKCLGDLIPGIRSELFPVTSAYGATPFFSIERAAAPYFGIKAYGVHMTGYVEKENGEKYIWVAKRSNTKQTFPSMLDHLVAGGLPYGISCRENMIKECEEEAGIPTHISKNVVPIGAVSYTDIEGFRYKRDVLFCYDLKLPSDFVPNNTDGEVESFRLIHASEVANIVKRTEIYKPNCALVLIDFLFRHGYIDPDCKGYLNLLQSLRSGDCS